LLHQAISVYINADATVTQTLETIASGSNCSRIEPTDKEIESGGNTAAELKPAVLKVSQQISPT
jgi:hypothetical protein